MSARDQLSGEAVRVLRKALRTAGAFDARAVAEIVRDKRRALHRTPALTFLDDETGLADVGGVASPTTLRTYTGPVANDVTTLSFRQRIGAADAGKIIPKILSRAGAGRRWPCRLACDDEPFSEGGERVDALGGNQRVGPALPSRSDQQHGVPCCLRFHAIPA